MKIFTSSVVFNLIAINVVFSLVSMFLPGLFPVSGSNWYPRLLISSSVGMQGAEVIKLNERAGVRQAFFLIDAACQYPCACEWII